MRSRRITVDLARAAVGVVLLAAVAAAQGTTRVSVDSAGVEGNSSSYFSVSASADGQVVAFYSYATNLVAGDWNGNGDVFVHDRATGITERVSVDSAGAEANGDSGYLGVSISADGQCVAFFSTASSLVAGDTNWDADIFVHDRATGRTERVSVDSAGAEANGDSYLASISADGRFVAFASMASNLVAGDTSSTADVFVHDRATGITERVSVDSAGAEGNGDSGFNFPYYDESGLSISADGQSVAFWSMASNLVPGDKNGTYDIFVHDRSTGITERVSVDSAGAEANYYSILPSLSADGQCVAFVSYATNLVAGGTNGQQVFVHDRATGLTELVSVDSAGAQGDQDSIVAAISGNGQTVAFQSYATNLVAGDTNVRHDIFVHQRTTGLTDRVSVDSASAQSNDDSYGPSISSDGQVVAFWSYSSDLVAGDTNKAIDVFVHCGATWRSYGTGFPGTNGVPSLTAQTPPAIGSTLTVDLANSWGNFTNGLVFLGFQRASIPSSWGGFLLVVPAITQLIGVEAGGGTLAGSIPNDPALIGVTVDLQAIELDPGAAKGMSFTPGLELVFGR